MSQFPISCCSDLGKTFTAVQVAVNHPYSYMLSNLPFRSSPPIVWILDVLRSRIATNHPEEKPPKIDWKQNRIQRFLFVFSRNSLLTPQAELRLSPTGPRAELLFVSTEKRIAFHRGGKMWDMTNKRWAEGIVHTIQSQVKPWCLLCSVLWLQHILSSVLQSWAAGVFPQTI